MDSDRVEAARRAAPRTPPLDAAAFHRFAAVAAEEALIRGHAATLVLISLAPPAAAIAAPVAEALRPYDRVGLLGDTELALFLDGCETADAPAVVARLLALASRVHPAPASPRVALAPVEAYDDDAARWIALARSALAPFPAVAITARAS